MMELEIKSP